MNRQRTKAAFRRMGEDAMVVATLLTIISFIGGLIFGVLWMGSNAPLVLAAVVVIGAAVLWFASAYADSDTRPTRLDEVSKTGA